MASDMLASNSFTPRRRREILPLSRCLIIRPESRAIIPWHCKIAASERGSEEGTHSHLSEIYYFWKGAPGAGEALNLSEPCSLLVYPVKIIPSFCRYSCTRMLFLMWRRYCQVRFNDRRSRSLEVSPPGTDQACGPWA